MKIHLVTNLFHPDELAGASLFTDLALFLSERNHDVRVTSTFSYYPAWKLRPEDQGVACRDETFRGIPVRRVAMHVPARPNARGRLLSDFSFLFRLIAKGRHKHWKPDVVVSALPMLSQCIAQRFLYLGQELPKLIVVQDFVVEAALELGILPLPGISNVLRKVQSWALRSAQTLVTISPGMLEKLRQSVGSDRRTLMIPNWIHGSLQSEIDRQLASAPRRSSGVLLYSGNLGIKQGLPDFVSSFKDSDSGWILKIRGGGAEASKLSEMTTASRNIEIGGVLSEPEYINELLTATACLVTQRPNVGANFLPSKLLPALATGTPVIAVCDSHSPLAFEVLDGAFGLVISPGNPQAVRQCLEKLRLNADLLQEYSSNAFKRAVRYHRDKILPLYESEICRLVSERLRRAHLFSANSVGLNCN